MAIRNYVNPSLGPRRMARITTVDPTTRKIEAQLKDGGEIQISLFDVPTLFVWPKPDEYWIVRQDGGYWKLNNKFDNNDDTKVAHLDPGEAKIAAETVKTPSGKTLVAIDNSTATSGQVIGYKNGTWVPINQTGGSGTGSANTIRYGAGAPANSLGSDGDFYIDTGNDYIYGPKASGSWPSGTSLVGPQGSPGATGATGTTGATGAAGAPGVIQAINPTAPITASGTSTVSIGLSIGSNLTVSGGSLTTTGLAPTANPTFTGTVNAANVSISGDLTVSGTTTTIDTTNLKVKDQNIEINNSATPSASLDGSGITILGGTSGNKTFQWNSANSALTANSDISISSGQTYKIGSTTVLSSTQILGRSVGTDSNATDLVDRGTAQTLTNKTIGVGQLSGQVAISNGGTGAATAANNTVFAGPTTGGPLAPSFRTLTAGDIPSIDLTTKVTGTLPVANGGTGITSLGAGVATFLGTPSSANLASAVTDETGSGSLVFNNSPSLTTPTIGVATATSINRVTITTPTTGSTLTIANGKTLTANNTLTFTGTDTSSVAFGGGGTVAYTANKLNAFAATTSSELAEIISDETGSGALVFGTSPTIASPTFSGTISAGSNRIQNVTDPTSAQDAATKNYADALTPSGTPGFYATVNGGSSATTIAPVSSSLVAIRFTCPSYLVATKMLWNVTTLAASSTLTGALYDASGINLLAITGAVSATTTGVKTGTLGPSYTFRPGVTYWAGLFSVGAPAYTALTPTYTWLGTTVATAQAWLWSGNFVVPSNLTGGGATTASGPLIAFAP